MKISITKKILWVLSGVVLGGALVLGTSVLAKGVIDNSNVASTAKSNLPLDELRTFVEVFERISQNYVEPIEAKILFEGAISGMLSSLDPHSAYLPPKSFKRMEEHTTGEFGGLGMEVSLENGLIKIVSPIDDTPAKKAGIRAGDLIIKLDDERVKGKTLMESIKIMRGKPGTKITLTIIREGETQPLVIELTRAIIKTTSVRHQLLTNNIGYVRISQFQLRTGADVIDAITALKLENDKPLNGLVLDLRNNPGGVLRAAVEVSDVFLDSGLIVYTEGRHESSKAIFEASHGDLMKNKPIVILINEGSASASEIVAGALQDHQRALIAGRVSFGKGSVQTLMPLNNGGAIKLTTAHYFTPNGHSIQEKGIQPDIVIPRARLEKLRKINIEKEQDLDGHLENDNLITEAEEKTKDDIVADLLEKDYELNEAFNLLKGMYFTHRMHN